MRILKNVLLIISFKRLYVITLIVLYIFFIQNSSKKKEINTSRTPFNEEKKIYYEKFILDIPIYNHSHEYSKYKLIKPT